MDPKPMDPKRLAAFRDFLDGGEPPGLGEGYPLVAYALELLADRDYQEGVAIELSEELAPLCEAAANVGNIDGLDGRCGSDAIDAVVNAGASCMIAALRAHPDAENGIRVEVTVEPGGRPASVFAQWGQRSPHDVVASLVRERELEAALASTDRRALSLSGECTALRAAIETAIAESEDGSASDAIQEMLVTLRGALEPATEASRG